MIQFDEELEDGFIQKKASAEETAIFNERLYQHAKAAPSGELQKFGSAGSRYIKTTIKETSFFDSILPSEPSPPLDRFEHTEEPGHIEDMQNSQYGAMTLPLTGTPDSRPYRGIKFTIFYQKISSSEYVKHVDELRGYTMNLRQVTMDNLVRDVDTEVDANWIRLTDRIAGAANGNGAAGFPQHFEIEDSIRRESYKSLVPMLTDRLLNNGIWLTNRHTPTEFLGWGRDEIGGDDAQRILKEGLKGALDSYTFFGIPHLSTIKNWLVPNFRVYQYTEPDFMGRHYVLEELHMYVEKRDDILKFRAHKKIGVSVPHVNGINVVDFV